MKKYTAEITALIIASVCSVGLTSCERNVPASENSGGNDISTTSSETPEISEIPEIPEIPEISETSPIPEKKIEVIDGITYVNGILIANKSYSLPSSYNPGGLTDETYSAFEELSYAASVDGLDIYISSGFRSYETQDEIYNNYVYWNGQEVADTFSARPGYSEHQTGLAIDVNTIDDSFAGTPEAIWLEENCTDYGFIIRYPQGKQDITGYQYEPWHIRYVGKEVAEALRDASISAGDPTLTLEEYLGIDSYYHN